jgi:hypothetical protein
MQNPTYNSFAICNPDSGIQNPNIGGIENPYPGPIFWNLESTTDLESGIQVVESGIQRAESGIQRVESGIQGVHGLPYMGRKPCSELSAILDYSRYEVSYF